MCMCVFFNTLVGWRKIGAERGRLGGGGETCPHITRVRGGSGMNAVGHAWATRPSFMCDVPSGCIESHGLFSHLFLDKVASTRCAVLNMAETRGLNLSHPGGGWLCCRSGLGRGRGEGARPPRDVV